MPTADAVATFTNDKLRLRVEAVREDVVHFELAAVASPTSPSIAISQMIARREPAIAWTQRSAATLSTRELEIEVDTTSLCVKVTDVVRGFVLHRLCPAAA